MDSFLFGLLHYIPHTYVRPDAFDFDVYLSLCNVPYVNKYYHSFLILRTSASCKQSSKVHHALLAGIELKEMLKETLISTYKYLYQPLLYWNLSVREHRKHQRICISISETICLLARKRSHTASANGVLAWEQPRHSNIHSKSKREGPRCLCINTIASFVAFMYFSTLPKSWKMVSVNEKNALYFRDWGGRYEQGQV